MRQSHVRPIKRERLKMTDFGWSYPAGCSGPPEDEYDDEHCMACGKELDFELDDCGYCSLACESDGPVWDGTVSICSVSEFCTHIGIAPISDALRAIDKYNIEAVYIKVQDKWLGPDDNADLTILHDKSRISGLKVVGIAWDGSDWEYSEESDTLEGLDDCRQNFEDALEEHNNDMETWDV